MKLRSGVSMARMMVVMVMMMTGGEAEMHFVGGKKNTWAPNINFSDWSSHQTFLLGDWLYFGYNKYQYNVLEVNQTSFESCIDRDFINNYTRGAGRDVVQLNELKTYYFLSGGGYCFGGMKVAVPVTGPDAPPAPAPSPLKNDSPVTVSVGRMTSTVVLVVSLLMFIWII